LDVIIHSISFGGPAIDELLYYHVVLPVTSESTLTHQLGRASGSAAAKFHTNFSASTTRALPESFTHPAMSNTFRGVVFHGTRDVRVEDRPFPDLKDWGENDAIVKVTTAGIPIFLSFVDVKDYVAVIFTVCSVRGELSLQLHTPIL
jgi:hypothetical protein